MAIILGVSYYNYANQTPSEALKCHSVMYTYQVNKELEKYGFVPKSESDKIWLRSAGQVFENCTFIEVFKTIDVDETEVDIGKGFDNLKKQLQKDFSQD